MATAPSSWISNIETHAIFTPPSTSEGEPAKNASFDLFAGDEDRMDESASPMDGRKSIMCLRESDLLLAVGKEVRIASLSDSKVSVGTKASSKKGYKTLHTPNIQFEILQIALNPSGKLLAVAGSHQVAVIVLPRGRYSQLVPATIDCKSLQVGQYYYATSASPRIAKIEWHPLGDGGTTLLVMTADGTLREYDMSTDPDEPLQTISFFPSRARGYVEQTEREAVSFTLGRGKADWGPLTVYALMRNGDVWAMCPFLPTNASVPSAYIHSLECFVSAKQEIVSKAESETSENLSTVYDYQLKYVNGLLKQLPPNTVFPATSKMVSVHPPATMKSAPMRQGPFLFQPAPPELSDGGSDEATDIIYLSYGDEEQESEAPSERLGVVLLAYQDGRVDICLDVDKVEARWETSKQVYEEASLPMLGVFETVDLGITQILSKEDSAESERWLQSNHPVFQADSIYSDTVYVYHSFGIHCLAMRPWLRRLTRALQDGGEDALSAVLEKQRGTQVLNLAVIKTLPQTMVGMAITNDVFLPYGLLAVTSSLNAVGFELQLRFDEDAETPPQSAAEPLEANANTYVSILEREAFVIPPILSRPSGLPATPKFPSSKGGELEITAESLRFLGQTVERFRSQMDGIGLAVKSLYTRIQVQQQEYIRQQQQCAQMVALMNRMRSKRADQDERVRRVTEDQKALVGRLDKKLQKLTEANSPELSEVEKKWFAELQRMKAVVIGSADARSLKARADMVRTQLDIMLPSLRVLSKEESQRKLEGAPGLGESQVLRVGQWLGEGTQKIEDATRKLRALSIKLDYPLDDSQRKS